MNSLEPDENVEHSYDEESRRFRSVGFWLGMGRRAGLNRSDRLAFAHRSPSTTSGRSEATPARYFARTGPVRLEAAHHAQRRSDEHHRIF
jgi:hypothetical protein